MKQHPFFVSVLMAAALFASCDGTGDFKTTDYKIRGVWKSADTSVYTGILVINSETITISNYAEIQTSKAPDKDDNKRPFKGFTKDKPLACYTEDENLVISKDVPGLPYTLTDGGKSLSFTFGDREERLTLCETTDTKLDGTWDSYDDEVYAGTLEIKSAKNTITITGYDKGPTSSGKNDDQRPFTAITKNTALTCCTADGKLFIKSGGNIQGFSYTDAPHPEGQSKYLLSFEFGGRKELLQLRGY